MLAMLPVIKRLYTDPEDIKAALKRYLVFFNTEPSFIGNVIPGICASLEEERANGADISDEMINGLRTGLMGPLAGVGDSLAGGIIYRGIPWMRPGPEGEFFRPDPVLCDFYRNHAGARLQPVSDGI